MKKAFDQTVRDIKREVNKKVLKVPSIEQKVLDATSNEPWGPHGSHLADVAQASRNYHEYQMIMTVIWKRINDTGKNWRHVYKALTVLEYLVGHGSERVIDEIREHAYQISTLSDFQYIDSSGRDQGSNVRKKSQSLVVLVNDKERIQEVRQKAAANRDKYRTTSGGGMYRPGSYSSFGGYGDRYDDDRYGGRDEDRNGYGRDKEWANRDDDRYGRYGDPYSRDGDRYGRDYEDRYSRDGYKDDDYKERSRSMDDLSHGSRSRSSDRERGHAYEDDGQQSRGSYARGEDHSQDGSFSGRQLDRKFSEQNLAAPPSYEEAMSDARSSIHSERDGEAPRSSSPPANLKTNLVTVASVTAAASASPPAPVSPPAASPSLAIPSHPSAIPEADGFDEFDPRGSFKAVRTPAPATSGASEMDLLGSLSDSFSSDALAVMPLPVASVSSDPNMAFDDPFGDAPFKAVTSSESLHTQSQDNASSTSFLASGNQGSEPHQKIAQDFGNPYSGMTYAATSAPNPQFHSTNPPYLQQEQQGLTQETDILADILPPMGPLPSSVSQSSFPAAIVEPSMTGISAQNGQLLLVSGFPSQIDQSVSQAGFQSQINQPSPVGFPSQTGQYNPHVSFPAQLEHSGQAGYQAQAGQYLGGLPGQGSQTGSQSSFIPSGVHSAAATNFSSNTGYGSEAAFPASSAQTAYTNANFYGKVQSSAESATPVVVQVVSQIHPGQAPMASQAYASSVPIAPNMSSQIQVGPTVQSNSSNAFVQSSSSSLLSSQVASRTQSQSSIPMGSQSAFPVSTGPLSATASQPTKDKFEPKSTIWADSLSRGLVNLNISGPKTNPLADIGVDFDAINRKEKRMEKITTTPVTSNITMGKAMGSGSGIGRAGASVLRAPSNPMMGSGMGMGLAGGPGLGAGMGMGVYGANTMGMGMNMNMGMTQGGYMQQPAGFPPGSVMPGSYNPRMGTGQQYGGYR